MTNRVQLDPSDLNVLPDIRQSLLTTDDDAALLRGPAQDPGDEPRQAAQAGARGGAGGRRLGRGQHT